MRDRIRLTVACGLVLAVTLAATAGASRLITGGQIKNGSIGLVDLSKSARRALSGKTGPQGATGPQGPSGPAGANSVQVVTSPTVTLASGDDSYSVAQAGGPSLEADCPAGQVAVGTGFNASVGTVGFVESFGTLVGGFVYNDSPITIEVTVQAMCIPGTASGTVATSHRQEQDAFARAAAQAETRSNR